MKTRLLLQLWWSLSRLRERDRWTRRQLEEHQANALRELRAFAVARSPFYRRFHEGLTDRPFGELPVLTKSVLMEHFDEIVTDRSLHLADLEAHLSSVRGDERFLGRYRVNATSGSTGRRGIFPFDQSEWLHILTSFGRAHELGGAQVSLTHRMRMASVASTAPWHMSARVAATLDSRWMPALRLDAGEPLHGLVARLNEWQSEMLVAYASMAHVLAREQLAGRLRISPHLIFTSSEVLTEGMRLTIERAWGRHLFNQYGATETGDVAAECEHHRGLHLFEDSLIVEVVDAKNRPVPVGDYGEKLLVTVLFSRTLPLIRYELSDSIRLAAEPCPCGRPFAVIDDIQGRAEEVLSFATPSGRRVEVHPHVFHRVLDTAPAGGWQVIQGIDGLTVLLVGGSDEVDHRLVIEALTRELRGLGIVDVPIKVRRVAEIPRSATGKLLLVRVWPAGSC